MTIRKERLAEIADGYSPTHQESVAMARELLERQEPVGIVRYFELGGAEHPPGIHVTLYRQLPEGTELYSTETTHARGRPDAVCKVSGGGRFYDFRALKLAAKGDGEYALYLAAPVATEDFDTWFGRVLRPAMELNGIKAAEQKMVYSSTQLAWEASKENS